MSEFIPVIVALVFNGLDLITGIIYAVKEKDLKSSKLRDGLFKKIGFILCYTCAWLVDNFGYYIGFDITVQILPVVVGYACLTELVSILENISRINSDLLPEKLMELFNIARKDDLDVKD